MTLSSRFGQFQDSGRAFVIADPNTPMPWVNVICNGHYGLVVSQNGGGFSWYDDAQHNVLTRWEMDLARDQSGKYLYLADLDDGHIWSVAPAPCRVPMEAYRCTHTMGRTTFEITTRGIAAVWSLGVASDAGAEIWKVTLTNTTNRPRRLRLSSYFDWCCGVAPDSKREFHRLFFTTTHDAKRHAIFATKNMWDIPTKSEKEHWNIPWPYVAAHAVCGFKFDHDLAIADKSTFFGHYGQLHQPKAMTGAIPASAKDGRFGDAAAALGGDFTLAPGKSVSLHYLIVIADTFAQAEKLVDQYSDAAAADNALHEAEQRWHTRLSSTRITSDREDFDLLNNHWLTYQAISGRMWGRTGYYQQSGARGFRDQLQDSQVWLPIEPSRTADQIMLHATRQFVDGSVNHWWHALADFGNHTQCSDDYLWLPFLTCAYIRETGDYSILDRTAPFRDSAQATSLLDHCQRSIARAFGRTSPRGLPHIGSCDWNDGLSAMGVEEKGESVWLAMFLCQILGDMAHVLTHRGDQAKAGEYLARRDAYAKAINAHAWDGAWYRYGTKDNGEWIGASACAEGRIHLNAQTWSILTDIAPAERAQAAWESVKKNLLSPYGPLLLFPAYTVPDPTIGYVTRYSPGSRENGGVYMHAATWALAAAAKLKDAASVQKIWDSVSPAWRGRDADKYWAEPYVTPGNVDGPLSDLPGRAGWTWYTGSAAWLNRVSLEWVLGIRPTWEGLRIDPCPAAALGQVKVSRRWRGVDVQVQFDASEYPGSEAGEARLVVDGREIEGCTISPEMVEGKKSVHVTARWSEGSPATVRTKTHGRSHT
ncbi:MAG: glycosyl transferase family 36 [Tepidisphaera sp.]|nr:glycosyl transferase family 36 [Tepidisphaera sp.]